MGDPFKEIPEHTGEEPFIYLKNYLESFGYEIRLFSNDYIHDAAWIFFWDIPSGLISRSCGIKILNPFSRIIPNIVSYIKIRKFEKILNQFSNRGLRDKLVLFLWEPPAVLPQNYNRNLHSKFKYIFTWNDAFVDTKKYIKYYWPQNGNTPVFLDNLFHNRKLIVNISGNKTSTHTDELYSERNKFIRYCEKAIPTDFDLFGPGWEADSLGTKYPSWCGTVKNKSEIYSNYKFGLVYENMKNIDGWVSEKIFDCIRCGCVPIYWGASNIENYVHSKSFIDRRMFESEEDLINYLSSITEKRWIAFREAGKNYINSDDFAKFLPANFSSIILNKLVSND
jgi:hypothetical protein